jgi:hypothetical protein
MDHTQARDTAAERPIHRACLVAGCPCQAGRSVPARRPAFVATAVQRHGESAGQQRLPELAWRFAGIPIA